MNWIRPNKEVRSETNLMPGSEYTVSPLGSPRVIYSCCVLVRRLATLKVLLRPIVLACCQEEDQETVNHGYRRNIKDVVRVVWVGKTTQKNSDMLDFIVSMLWSVVAVLWLCRTTRPTDSENVWNRVHIRVTSFSLILSLNKCGWRKRNLILHTGPQLYRAVSSL